MCSIGQVRQLCNYLGVCAHVRSVLRVLLQRLQDPLFAVGIVRLVGGSVDHTTPGVQLVGGSGDRTTPEMTDPLHAVKSVRLVGESVDYTAPVVRLVGGFGDHTTPGL